MTPDIFRLSLENKLLQLLAELESIPDTYRVETAFGTHSVILQIAPRGNEAAMREARTACERDCLEVIRAAPKGLTRLQIMERLEQAGKVWGDSTVGNALANMVSDGVIDNTRKRGGYHLPTSA